MPSCDSTTCKRNPSCGCPECRLHLDDCTACCRCIPTTICVTISPDEESPCSVELDWDNVEQHFTGSLRCHGTTYDLLFYFERDEDECFFKLRSEELGFPEGYEHAWKVGEEILCNDLMAGLEVGDLSLDFEAVFKPTPKTCKGCQCLCECVCITVSHPDGTNCTGRLCWDEGDGDAWVGTVECMDAYGDILEHDARVEWRRRGEFCDQLAELLPYEDCDPCDDECILVLQIPGLDIEDELPDPEYLIQPCRERNVGYSWRIPLDEDPYEEIEVSISCSPCNAECGNASLCCFEPNLAPRTLTLTLIDWWTRPPITETTLANPDLFMSACVQDGDRRAIGSPTWESGCSAFFVPDPDNPCRMSSANGEYVNDTITLTWNPARRGYVGQYVGAFRFAGTLTGTTIVAHRVPQVIDFFFQCDLGVELYQYLLQMEFRDSPETPSALRIPNHLLEEIVNNVDSLGGYDHGGPLAFCDPLLARFGTWPLDPCTGNSILITE